VPPAHLIPSLEPKLRELYQRHQERAAKVDWAYYEYLPLDELRANPQALPQLSASTYLAVETALFTEVNLPWFTSGLAQVFKGSLSPMQEFIYEWTSEEDQHAMLLETYLLLGDNGDHRERARLRKLIIRQGWTPHVEDHFQAIAYTALQELATQQFYFRVADVCADEDPLLARALRRLAKDETLHMAFYRDAVTAHLEAEPNYVEPLAQIMLEFAMPGAEMPGYAQRATQLAAEGIYGPDHYYNMVVDKLWRDWNVSALSPQAASARDAQKRLIDHHAQLGRVAARITARRVRKADHAALEPGAAGDASAPRVKGVATLPPRSRGEPDVLSRQPVPPPSNGALIRR
jgi:acyl-[acyl-carrier-protein] desaturase